MFFKIKFKKGVNNNKQDKQQIVYPKKLGILGFDSPVNKINNNITKNIYLIYNK